MVKKKKGLFKVGLFGAALGAVGSWFLFGTEAGKKKQADIATLAAKIKDDVLVEAKRLKVENEPAMHGVIEHVVAKYHGLQNIDRSIFDTIASELKTHWSEVKDQFIAGEQSSKKDAPLS